MKKQRVICIEGTCWRLTRLVPGGLQEIIFFTKKNPETMDIAEIEQCPQLYRDVTLREALQILGTPRIPKTARLQKKALKGVVNGAIEGVD